MKRHLLALSLLTTGAFFASCSETNYHADAELTANAGNEVVGTIHQAPTYAEPDNATLLNGTPSENLMAIFKSTGPKIITSMGRMNITDEQYEEIKAFTNELVKDCTTQKQKYDAIHNWAKDNIQYSHSDNDPYPVFINRTGVCQGYANLVTVMCYSQDIPIVVVNGYLSTYGAHAWVYACPDGKWYVGDPTNGYTDRHPNGCWAMDNISGYPHLIPQEADVDLFTDDYATYRYYDHSLNIDKVTTTSNPLVVPYSVGGFVINSFNPSEELPAEITDVYLGENITTFGESYNMRLITNNFGKNLQAIYVDESNPTLLEHKGIVYRKNGDQAQLYYIPGGMELIELMPMEVVEKNTIYNHYAVKDIYFPEGTKKIEDSAIENCPKLERVYIPEGAEMDNNAIYNCPQNVEIIRGIPNSIKHIYAD